MSTDLIKKDESFPVLTGDIVVDTSTIIGELAVGTVAIERGLARLYLVWRSKMFLNAVESMMVCDACGVPMPAGEIGCIRCGGLAMTQETPQFPNLESYVQYVSMETGKSRQTLFNRLRTYRSLCDDRGVEPELVFRLVLLSSGAASKLAGAKDSLPTLSLIDDSWEETVVAALSFGNRSSALEFIKYDILKEPKIYADYQGEADVWVHVEYVNPSDDALVIEKYKFVLEGEWDDQAMDWLSDRLNFTV